MNATEKKAYCCGFLFWEGSVLLCQKLVPKWQAGYWNGIGGKIESGETAAQAMDRESLEEIHLEQHHMFGRRAWEKFAEEEGRDYVVHFFRARANNEYAPPSRNDAGERLLWTRAEHLSGVIGNLHWLIPLALDWRRFREPLRVTALDDITERATW